MIKTYQELKEAFCDFTDNNDGFPSVDVLQNTSDYSLVYTGAEPIERKDFELPISHEDFEIQEAITYLDGELYGSQSDSQHQPDKLIETIADAQEFVASKYQQHSTDTVFKPYTKKSKLNAVSFEDSEGFETIVEIPCTPNSLELALLLAWGE